MTTRSVVALGFVAAVSCASDTGRASSSFLLSEPSTAPAEIRADCAIAERRCSRCHPLDRITNTRVTSPGGWQSYVRRMRLTPGSGIPMSEEPAIVRCLVFRSFGSPAVQQLEESPEYQ